MKTNSYNVYSKNHSDTALYHAVARDREQVLLLAKEKSFDIDGDMIELERENIVNEMGRPIEPYIEDCQVR